MEKYLSYKYELLSNKQEALLNYEKSILSKKVEVKNQLEALQLTDVQHQLDQKKIDERSEHLSLQHKDLAKVEENIHKKGIQINQKNKILEKKERDIEFIRRSQEDINRRNKEEIERISAFLNEKTREKKLTEQHLVIHHKKESELKMQIKVLNEKKNTLEKETNAQYANLCENKLRNAGEQKKLEAEKREIVKQLKKNDLQLKLFASRHNRINEMENSVRQNQKELAQKDQSLSLERQNLKKEFDKRNIVQSRILKDKEREISQKSVELNKEFEIRILRQNKILKLKEKELEKKNKELEHLKNNLEKEIVVY